MTAHTQRTKTVIQKTFMTLLQTNEYETITMIDIARRSGRTRSTLYRHYPDKEAILLDCLSQVTEALKEKISYPSADPNQGIAPVVYSNLVLFYTHVAAHPFLYRALFQSSASPVIRTSSRRVIAGILLTINGPSGGILANSSAPREMVVSLIGEMVIGAVVWWLDNRSEYSPALLAEIVLRLCETGVFGLNAQTPMETDLSYRPFVAHCTW